MATMTFDEIGHRYELDGVIVPSVTQVLTLAGISDLSGVPQHLLDRAAAIGTAVHSACEFLDQDDLDLESLDPLVIPYVVGYQKFREETGFKAELIEHRMVGELSGMSYGMCIDRVGRAKGSELPIVLDIKTSSKPQASWAIQTAAYARGLGDPDDYARWIVHVNKDGRYKIIVHNLRSDDDVWESALRVAYWRLENGAKLK